MLQISVILEKNYIFFNLIGQKIKKCKLNVSNSFFIKNKHKFKIKIDTLFLKITCILILISNVQYYYSK